MGKVSIYFLRLVSEKFQEYEEDTYEIEEKELSETLIEMAWYQLYPDEDFKESRKEEFQKELRTYNRVINLLKKYKDDTEKLFKLARKHSILCSKDDKMIVYKNGYKLYEFKPVKKKNKESGGNKYDYWRGF